jgi:hypothetical protein
VPIVGWATVIVPVDSPLHNTFVLFTVVVKTALTVTCDVAVPLHGAVPKL